MKTIILSTNNKGQIKALESVMKGALAFGFVISKYVKVFDTQKQAKGIIKNHPCSIERAKYLVLNKKQVKAIEYLRNRGGGYFKINDFLSLKD